jgi:CarD family transcriptional regulator
LEVVYVFKVGDKVVYPMHGAGVIEAIEEKEILGKKREYYVMHLPVGNIKVMVPMKSADDIGIREVVDEQGANRVIEILKDEANVDLTNWNHRYRANLEKMRSGDIYELADVVRSLMQRESDKGLSTGERKMLDNAKQMLVSELVLAKEMDEEQALSLLDSTVQRNGTSTV